MEVNRYLDLYTVPFIWGGDFNRSTVEFEEQGTRQGGHYCVAPPDDSTCLGGVRIDYFVTNGAREHIHVRCTTVQGKVRPHSPVLMQVKYRPHLTKVKGLVRVRQNLAEGLELGSGTRRKGQVAITDVLPTWAQAERQYAEAARNGKLFSTIPYMNMQQRQYVEATNCVHGEALTKEYEKWSDTHALHLAARQGMDCTEALGVIGKGHTPKLGYFAPGSACPHQDLTWEDYLGWIMHTGQRLHVLSRMPCDEHGQRSPSGRQQTTWMKMLEADLALQAVTIPLR